MRKFAGIALAPLLLLAGASVARADDAADTKAFRDYLTKAVTQGSTDKAKVAAFYKTTSAYWGNHWRDYTDHPEKYADVMALYRKGQIAYPHKPEERDPERYRKDIEAFKAYDSKNAPQK